MTARELDALDGLLAELRTAVVRPLPAEVADRHLGALSAAASESSVRRRSPVLRAAVAVAACVTLFGVTGGLAAAGALPAPLQDGVADVAGMVGINLPGSSSRAPGHQPDDPTQPGRSEHAPGRQPDDPTRPGRSEHAPGQQPTGETPTDVPAGATPGATAPGREHQPEGTGGPEQTPRGAGRDG
jgi:hypothetical protein